MDRRLASRNDLAALWLDPAIRAAVTAAANEIDFQLERDPLRVVESRPNNRRILIESPLAIIYKVKRAERNVIVLRVWRIS